MKGEYTLVLTVALCAAMAFAGVGGAMGTAINGAAKGGEVASAPATPVLSAQAGLARAVGRVSDALPALEALADARTYGERFRGGAKHTRDVSMWFESAREGYVPVYDEMRRVAASKHSPDLSYFDAFINEAVLDEGRRVTRGSAPAVTALGTQVLAASMAPWATSRALLRRIDTLLAHHVRDGKVTRQLERARASWSLLTEAPTGRFDPRQIGERIVDRLERLTRSVPDERSFPEMAVVMGVPIDALDDLSTLGFRSRIQFRHRERYAKIHIINQHMAKVPSLGVSPGEVHPKYAYLAPWGLAEQEFRRQYGTLLVRFKDDVHRRTTYTADDSLDSGLYSQALPVSKTYWVDDAPGLTPYHEAQVWGELTLNDAEAIYVDAADFQTHEAALARLQALHGFAVHRYEPSPTFLGFHITNVEEVIPASAAASPPFAAPTVAALEKRIEALPMGETRNAYIVALGEDGSPAAMRALRRMRADIPSELRQLPAEKLSWEAQFRTGAQHLELITIRKALAEPRRRAVSGAALDRALADESRATFQFLPYKL